MKTEKRPKPSGVTGARRTSAVLALLTSPTIEAAADLAHVSRSSLFLWMKDSTFTAELDAARVQAFNGGLMAIKGAATKAAEKILGLLDSRNEALRLRAALAVIELGLRVHEVGDINDRISRLEDAILQGNPSGGK